MKKKIKLSSGDIQYLIGHKAPVFPKYISPIINLANGYSGGTKPKIVGQMSDLIQEFKGRKLSQWDRWYKSKHPESIKLAAEKILPMIKNFKQAIDQIDQKMTELWLEDLVVTKTFTGLRFQEAILKKVALEKNTTFRLAAPKEEARGIDGYIGKTPVSIKPVTYKNKRNALGENIDCDLIFYEKKKNGVVIEFE